MRLDYKTTLFSIGILFLIGINNIAFSQELSRQHWLFGNNNIGIEFARSNNTPRLISKHTPPPNFGVKGNATANNPETGDILFYTDGVNIFDVSYNIMNGLPLVDNLGADLNKNQSVVITTAPDLGSNDLYYIFTNTPSGAIEYAEVDMTMTMIAGQPPLGSLKTYRNPISNSTANASDAMIIVPNASNDGYWLVTLDIGSNNYKVLEVDSATPASWLETTYTEGAPMDASHFTFNANTSKIAVAPKSQNVNIQLLDIDLATGVLSFDKEIPNSGNADFATEAIFDVEFSNDGSKLYYSRYGDQAGSIGNLMQFDLTATQLPISAQSVLPATVFGSYGAQLGPDGNLYHLYQQNNGGPFLVGRLLFPDSVASLTTYEPALENGQDFNTIQFPAFIPERNPQLSVNFTFDGTCANAPTAFFPQITPAPTDVLWDFGDGNTSNELAPFNTYTSGGTMNVMLTAMLNGQSMQFSQPVAITDFQLQLTLPQDTVACQCELPKYGPTCTPFSVTAHAEGGSGAETYLWSNGDVGATLLPDSAGFYYVVATDGICSTYAGVEVQEYDITLPGIAPDTRSNIWYFGQNAGIDFNQQPAVALNNSVMDTMEGCTAVSDKNGQIIFYTDGDILYDKAHTQIANGLGGTPNAIGAAAQSVISVEVPDNESLFYIFTTQSTDPTSPEYEFSHSLYNLKTNSVSPRSILFSKSTERVTANFNWVVIHEYGNNNFRAYPIRPTGIGSPVVSSVGEDYSFIFAENGKGYMKISPDATKLAVAVTDGNSPPNNYLDVYDFDNSSGEVSNLQRADLNLAGANPNGNAYGVEINGSKIFVSIKNGNSSQIMEYWIDYLGSLNLSGIMPIPVEVGAIQTGPDGQVYVAQNGSGALGSIAVNNDTLQASNFTQDSFGLAGGTSSQLGLPNFVQQTGTGGSAPGITTSSPACIGQPIFLSANLSSTIDEVKWQITDPAGTIVFTSSKVLDTLTLDSSGNFSVALLIKNRCLDPIGMFNEIIAVNPPPQDSDLSAATFLCGDNATLFVYSTLPTNIADLDFAWSTGETTASITVAAQGNYDVIITDRTSDCSVSATTFVGPPLLIDIGTDKTICENDPLTLDSQVNADMYVWTINGIEQPGTRFFDFGTQSLPGGTYTVQVDATLDLGGSIGSCTITDQTVITVNAAPIFSAAEGSIAGCGFTDGTINISLTSLGSYTYSINGLIGTILDSDPMPVNVGGISAGINALTLTNDDTGCSQLLYVTVTNPTSFSISSAVANDETCATGDGSIDYTVSGTIGTFTSTLRAWNNPETTFSGTGSGAANYSILNIPVGSYFLVIQEDALPNCIEIWIGNPATIPPVAQTLTIGRPLNSDLTISNNPILGCGNTLDLSAYVASITPGTTLEWSVDNFATSNPLAFPFTTFGSTGVGFRASPTVGPPATCEVIKTIEVIFTPKPTVTIAPDVSDICNGFVTLTATGDGSYANAQLGYRWSTGETTQSITVSSTNNYTVTAFHTINQSCFVNATENVTINPPFTVAVTSTLACDDGKPFTLTATPSRSLLNSFFSWTLNGTDQGLTNPLLTGLNEGLYEVTATENPNTPEECSAIASLNITRIPLTPANLSSALVFCPDDGPLTLDAGANFVSYLWNDGTTNQLLEVLAGGVYEITATNNFGCITNDQSNIVEDCIPKLSGPNAFRPGGLNSTYSLFTKYIDTFEIFIYDRWGTLVYNSSDLAFAWDGKINGVLLPAGQFSWVVRYTSSFRDRGVVEEYGGVTLLR